VVAFCHRLSLDRHDERTRALRAELRALGAALVLRGPRGLVLVDPDEEIEPLQAADGGDPSRALEAAFSIAADERRLTLLMVGPGGGPRWSWTSPGPVDDEAGALVDALARATTLRAEAWQGATRREVMGATVAAAVWLALTEPRAAAAPADAGASGTGEARPVTLQVNGTAHHLSLEPRVSLLDALRENLRLIGTKKGCDHGQCGACTVLIDGRRVLSCLTLAMTAEGSPITTIEGLARGGELHPMQAAFLQHDAFQCGYCTPGQIVSAVGLLREGHVRSIDEVREQMSGNICRCGAYNNIVAAIEQVRRG
jgi:xanthine dehydrogenase YagT iron-sulfur-binding subunit